MEGDKDSLCVLVPLPQAHGAHLLARFVTTGLEHSGDGVSVADGAEVLLASGLREEHGGCAGVGHKTPTLVHTKIQMAWICMLWIHSPRTQLPPEQMQRSDEPAFAPPGPAPPH